MIAAVIPDLRKPHPATAKKVRGARTVPREAVSSIVAVVEAPPVLQNVLPLDIDRAHEVLGSTDVYRLRGACRGRPPPPRTTQRRDGKAKEEAGVSGSPIATNRLQ